MTRSLIVLAVVSQLALGCSDSGGGDPVPSAPFGGASGVTGSGGAMGGQPPAGSGGALMGGTGGGPTAPQPVTPTQNGTVYSFATGELLFEVDAAVGARVTTLSLGGVNLLTGPEVNSINWGSTFWVGPQTWPWPPPAEIDSSPYTATIQGTHAVMTSSPSSLGVTVGKDFAVDSSGSISITYTLTGSGAAAVSWGPWEVSRVAFGGLSFFKSGTEPAVAPATESAGAIWLDTNGVTAEGKYAADGAGWLAHVQGDLLFVKVFSDQAPGSIATGQKEVELYTKPASYEELEMHGPYSNIAPGASVSWTVKWFVTRIPSGTPVTPGSADLVNLADSFAR